MTAKPARAVRSIDVERESSGSDKNSFGSDSDSDRRSVYMATDADRAQNPGDPLILSEQVGRDRHYDRGKLQRVCAHCGSKRHDDRGCWKRFTYQKCGRKGHPADKGYYVCSVCKDVHEEGKCPMEQFYNMIRQWYVSTKHAGMLPEQAEKMPN